MASGNSNLILDAQRKAMWLRQQLRIDLLSPVCIYDVAEARNVEVRFVDFPTAEGMYSRVPKPTILVAAERPSGRQVFTCGHELGHHEFGHGMHVDELLEQITNVPNEVLATAFAAALLMPKTGVASAFTKRGWNVRAPEPLHVYAISNWFGVGYTTLIAHMASTLNFVPKDMAKRLSQTQPKVLRKHMLGFDYEGELIVVDRHWSERAIDVRAGDMVMLPAEVSVEPVRGSPKVELVDANETKTLIQAVSPGIGRLVSRDNDWAAYIRVSRKGFLGRSIYRHLETPTMNEYKYIEADNLSIAWAKAFLRLSEVGVGALTPLVVSIGVVDGSLSEMLTVREALNQSLVAADKQSVETIANTIFPNRQWNPNKDRQELFRRYTAILPHVLKVPQNRNGTYFQRMTAFGIESGAATGFNQLEHILHTYARGNHRTSALQASIFSPVKDHTDQRQRGFPCLQHVQFIPDASRAELTITGVYATQLIYEKAYGNYLGLYQLGNFMAHEMGLRLRHVLCFVSRARLTDGNKTSLTGLAQSIRMLTSL